MVALLEVLLIQFSETGSGVESPVPLGLARGRGKSTGDTRMSWFMALSLLPEAFLLSLSLGRETRKVRISEMRMQNSRIPSVKSSRRCRRQQQRYYPTPPFPSDDWCIVDNRCLHCFMRAHLPMSAQIMPLWHDPLVVVSVFVQ